MRHKFLATLIGERGAQKVKKLIPEQLKSIISLRKSGLTEKQIEIITAAIGLARNILPVPDRYEASSPNDIINYWRTFLKGRNKELFCCMFLDQKNNVIDHKVLFEGTIDHASIYPREIITHALEVAAKSLILCHNHPSGDPEPSEDDRRITKEIKKAAALLDITLLDHVVRGNDGYISFNNIGWL